MLFAVTISIQRLAKIAHAWIYMLNMSRQPAHSGPKSITRHQHKIELIQERHYAFKFNKSIPLKKTQKENQMEMKSNVNNRRNKMTIIFNFPIKRNFTRNDICTAMMSKAKIPCKIKKTVCVPHNNTNWRIGRNVLNGESHCSASKSIDKVFDTWIAKWQTGHTMSIPNRRIICHGGMQSCGVTNDKHIFYQFAILINECCFPLLRKRTDNGTQGVNNANQNCSPASDVKQGTSSRTESIRPGHTEKRIKEYKRLNYILQHFFRSTE